MNIDEMTTQEKSAGLARLMGWRKRPLTTEQIKLFYGDWLSAPVEAWQDDEGHWLPQGLPDFYSTGNMAQAWGALNWANEKLDEVSHCSLLVWLCNVGLWRLSPAAAQRAWLDKILELAVEAGMVDDD